MLQMNFTAAVHPGHETVTYPRQHRSARKHLLHKVNLVGGRYVCALEIRLEVAPVLYLALCLEPSRTQLSRQFLFEPENSDAFLLGTVLLQMSN